MARYLEIEDLAANAFIAVLHKDSTHRFISYIDLEQYGERVIDILNQNAEVGKQCVLLLSRDRTCAMLEYHSEFFKEIELNGVKGLYLRDEKTANDLINRFRGYLPLDMMLAFMDKTAIAPLLAR